MIAFDLGIFRARSSSSPTSGGSSSRRPGITSSCPRRAWGSRSRSRSRSGSGSAISIAARSWPSTSRTSAALPSLAVIAFLGVGFTNIALALVVLAVPPILTNAYVGIDGVRRRMRSRRRAEWE